MAVEEEGNTSEARIPDHHSALHRTVSSPVRNHSNPDIILRSRSPATEQEYRHTLSPQPGTRHNTSPFQRPPLSSSQSNTVVSGSAGNGRDTNSPVPHRQSLSIGGSGSAFTRQTSLTDLENTEAIDGKIIRYAIVIENYRLTDKDITYGYFHEDSLAGFVAVDWQQYDINVHNIQADES